MYLCNYSVGMALKVHGFIDEDAKLTISSHRKKKYRAGIYPALGGTEYQPQIRNPYICYEGIQTVYNCPIVLEHMQGIRAIL